MYYSSVMRIGQTLASFQHQSVAYCVDLICELITGLVGSTDNFEFKARVYNSRGYTCVKIDASDFSFFAFERCKTNLSNFEYFSVRAYLVDKSLNSTIF